jgi:hypothetical protein
MPESLHTNSLIVHGLVKLHHTVSTQVTDGDVDPIDIIRELEKEERGPAGETVVAGKRRKANKDPEPRTEELIARYLKNREYEAEQQKNLIGTFRDLIESVGVNDDGVEGTESERGGQEKIEEQGAKESLSEILIRTLGLSWMIRIFESVVS